MFKFHDSSANPFTKLKFWIFGHFRDFFLSTIHPKRWNGSVAGCTGGTTGHFSGWHSKRGETNVWNQGQGHFFLMKLLKGHGLTHLSDGWFFSISFLKIQPALVRLLSAMEGCGYLKNMNYKRCSVYQSISHVAFSIFGRFVLKKENSMILLS